MDATPTRTARRCRTVTTSVKVNRTNRQTACSPATSTRSGGTGTAALLGGSWVPGAQGADRQPDSAASRTLDNPDSPRRDNIECRKASSTPRTAPVTRTASAPAGGGEIDTTLLPQLTRVTRSSTSNRPARPTRRRREGQGGDERLRQRTASSEHGVQAERAQEKATAESLQQSCPGRHKDR